MGHGHGGEKEMSSQKVGGRKTFKRGKGYILFIRVAELGPKGGGPTKGGGQNQKPTVAYQKNVF